MNNHFKNCNAPICAECPDKDWQQNVIWYAGEEVCDKKPYKVFQKRQQRINDWLKLGQIENKKDIYTASLLEKGKAIRNDKVVKTGL